MEMDHIDGEKLEDFDYVCDIFHEYISMAQFPDGNLRYWYQYEFDCNLSTYEEMMDKQCIVIAAKSLEEANILNAILRCIIDGHGAPLNIYLNDETEVSIEKFFQNIMDSDVMSNYRDYVSVYPKEIINHIINIGRLRNGANLGITIDVVRIFNKDNILLLLEDDSVRMNAAYAATPEYFSGLYVKLEYILAFTQLGG